MVTPSTTLPLRTRLKRTAIATLLLSPIVGMLAILTATVTR